MVTVRRAGRALGEWCSFHPRSAPSSLSAAALRAGASLQGSWGRFHGNPVNLFCHFQTQAVQHRLPSDSIHGGCRLSHPGFLRGKGVLLDGQMQIACLQINFTPRPLSRMLELTGFERRRSLLLDEQSLPHPSTSEHCFFFLMLRFLKARKFVCKSMSF